MSYGGSVGTDAKVGSGSVLSPPNNADIAQITAGNAPAGTYRLDIYLQLSATAETALNNLNLRDITAAAVIATGIPTIQSGGGIVKITIERITTTGGFGLRPIAGAVAGAVYTAFMLAYRID